MGKNPLVKSEFGSNTAWFMFFILVKTLNGGHSTCDLLNLRSKTTIPQSAASLSGEFPRVKLVKLVTDLPRKNEIHQNLWPA